MKRFLQQFTGLYYDNGDGNLLTAFVPEFWAREGLMVLVEELVMANLVYRDFENEIANFGDTVNTRLPGDFVALRKTDIDEVTIQDSIATNVQVVLNQHVHVSFMIKDGQESLAMQDLVETYMRPAMRANGNIVDKILLAQFTSFLLQSYGTFGTFNSTNAKDRFLNVRRIFNTKSVPEENRQFVLTVNSETAVLATDLFLQAQQVGDDGTALREASLGRKFGLNTFKSVFAPSVLESGTSSLAAQLGAVNLTAGYPVGYASTIVTDGFTGALTVGQWVSVGTNGTPYRIAAVSNTLGATTLITLDRPLTTALVDDDVIKGYKVGTVNQSVSPTGFALGWSKYITYDGGVNLQRGQMISFQTTVPAYAAPATPGGGPTITSPIYVIIDTDGTSQFMLDRPLEVALADNDVVNPGPGGEYNFAFIRNALALVTRPLAPPKAGVGALSAIANYNGMAMRATITYSGKRQGHLVTLDFLMGVKVLDYRMGVVIFG